MAFTRFIDAAQHDHEIKVFGDGEQIRDFTFVSDIVNANLLAGARGGKGDIYNLSGGSHATVNEVLRILEELHGAPLKVQRIEQQAGDVRRTGGDSSRAKRDLGWVPAVSLSEGLAKQYTWQLTNRRIVS